MLIRRFESMGARLKINVDPRFRLESPFVLDIQRDGRGEFFELRCRPGAELDAEAVDVRPGMRHLLLMVKRAGEQGLLKQKFLCGHDERAWFVAAIPEA